MRRIQRTRRGEFRLRLPPEEREALRSLPGQLRANMEAGGPSIRRLTPPAYAEDVAREAEYRGMVDKELTAGRLNALAVMEETIDADRLDEEQLVSWLAALNDIRLVLGTKLDVTEDMDPSRVPESDPRFSGIALYGYLSFLEEQVVEALAAGLA